MIKKYKKITYLLILLSLLILSSTNYKAFTCVYGDTNHKINVIIDNSGKAKAYYQKWENKTWNGNNGLGDFEEVVTLNRTHELEWKNYIYINKKCPRQAVGSYIGYACGLAKVFLDNTSHADETLCLWSKQDAKLPLIQDDTINISNPNEPTTLYLQPVGDDGKSEATLQSGKNGSVTTNYVVGKNYDVYVKTFSKNMKDGKYMNTNKLSCTSNAIEILSTGSLFWNLGNGQSYPNNKFAVLRIGAKKAGTAKVTCTYTKDDGNSVSGSVDITVKGDDSVTAQSENLTCPYTAKVDGTTITSFTATIKGWKDGKGANMSTEYTIKDLTGAETTLAANTKTSNYNGYGNINKPFQISSTSAEFITAAQKSGGCPPMYSAYYNPVIGSKYYYSTVNPNSYQGELTEAEDGYTLEGSGCKVNLSFKTQSGETKSAGSITFLRYKNANNQYKYAYVKNNNHDNKTDIGTTINGLTNISYGSIDGYTISVTVDTPAVRAIYNNYKTDGTSCNVQNLCSDSTGSFDSSLNYGVATIKVTTDTTTCSQNNSQTVSTENGNGTDPSRGSTGSEGGGRTDELEVLQDMDNNSTEDFCSILFDTKGSNGEHQSIGEIIKMILLGIRIVTPIILILLSMVEFAKATADDELMATAKEHSVTRGIVAIAIFFVPILVKLIFDLAGLSSCANLF